MNKNNEEVNPPLKLTTRVAMWLLGLFVVYYRQSINSLEELTALVGSFIFYYCIIRGELFIEVNK